MQNLTTRFLVFFKGNFRFFFRDNIFLLRYNPSQNLKHSKMLTIAKLFGKSPFAPLQTHMDKVASCVGELPSLFKAIIEQEMETIEAIRASISRTEHLADITKNEIRNHLPKSLFLQVDRSTLLDILSLQDAIADQAEEIAHQAGMRKVLILPDLQADFLSFASKSVETFSLARKVMLEIEELLECSFGGIEAQKVKGMVEKTAFSEYEMAVSQHKLTKRLYQESDALPYPAFHLLLTLVEEIGRLGFFSEKLAIRVRMLLEVK